MKQKMKKFNVALVTGIMALFISGATFGQCKEVVWPEDGTMRAKAEESKVLYEDAIKLGTPDALKSAVAPFRWMLKNVPNHHISLYIQGTDLYDKLASQEKAKPRKAAFVDTLMMIYDQRVQTCGDEKNVANRKALSFLKHMANEKPAETLQLMDKAIDLNKEEFMDGMLMPYMQVVRLNFKNLKNLTEEQVLQKYDRIMEITDAKIKKDPKNAEKLQKIKSDIDDLLIQTVTVNCDFVRKNLAPKFKQNPQDLNMARKIFTFMLKDKCTDDPLWLEAAETVHKLDTTKNCGLAKNLGIIYISKKDYEKAEQFLKEAQSICTEGQDKGDVLMYRGAIEAERGNRSAARDLFRQAAAASSELQKQAYEKIGDLYLGSFDTCKKLKSKVEDRLVFLIAYDYYQRAGDSKKMGIAKDNFPSKEEIFTEGMTAGTSMQVNCWINESTTLRTRD